MNEIYAKQILKIFANNPFDSFNHKQISSRVGAHDKGSRQLVIATLQELAEAKILVADENARGKYKINPKNINDDLLPKNYLIGTIDMKQTGKAYVIPQDENREDVLISANNTHHALHGDTVKVLMFPQRKMHKPEGQVVEVLKRARTRFVGIIQKQDRFAFLISDSRTMVVDIFIPLTDLNGAEDGEKVLVEMTDWPQRMNNPVGKVIKRLGRPGDNNVEMQSILAEYDFPLDFPSEAEREAEHIAEPTEKDYDGRKDFRNTTTFTIDPADAKDYDDAIAFLPTRKGQYEAGTIPMLPEKLCNGVCSLRPHEDKLCFSVVMEIDENAHVVKSWFGKTVINSDCRYSYEEAQAVIEGTKSEPLTPTDNAILQLHKLATILREGRYKDGAINFESQEVKFYLDENAKPIGVYIKESKEANWLIEEFMLLANRKVAERVGSPSRNTSNTKSTRSPKTFVYRVHDEPNREKLNSFVEFVAKLGYKIKTSSRPLPRPHGAPPAGEISTWWCICQRRRIRGILPPLLADGETRSRCRACQCQV